MRKLDYKKLCLNIEQWISNYVSCAGAYYIVVGLSGGIDSAVTSALCANAIGPDKVYGYSLPCFSIPKDVEDAKLVASEIGIKFKIYELDSVYSQFLSIVEPVSNQIAKANLKARLRMTTLYYIAQSIKKCLVAGTGNRAELKIGYFTKFGDGGVDFEPLGMLYKQEVRKIAKHLKLPESIITKAPSPGLWKGQTDESEIGIEYDIIDEILYRIDYKLDFDGLDDLKINRVQEMVKNSQHKLKLPPVYQIKQSDYLQA